MLKLNSLKYPPIKDFRTKAGIPDKLVFSSKIEVANCHIDKFVLISTKHKGEKALMRCYPESIMTPKGEFIKSLYVWTLDSSKSGLGLGSALLNFAKIHSKRLGLGGHLHLISTSEKTPERVPHIFYKKFGMNTDDIYINHKLDKFIKEGKTATSNDFSSVAMYYPPINLEPSKFDKFISKIKKFVL
jgi:hypothetical protein